MPNTIKQYTLDGKGDEQYVRRLITIESDGTEETDLIIYNNSDFVADVSKGQLMEVCVWGSTGATLLFEWDATTDQEIVQIAVASSKTKLCIGGLQGSNDNDSGATGDLLLTTLNLAADDVLSIEILVKQV